jgi:hypothetical protein
MFQNFSNLQKKLIGNLSLHHFLRDEKKYNGQIESHQTSGLVDAWVGGGCKSNFIDCLQQSDTEKLFISPFFPAPSPVVLKCIKCASYKNLFPKSWKSSKCFMNVFLNNIPLLEV